MPSRRAPHQRRLRRPRQAAPGRLAAVVSLPLPHIDATPGRWSGGWTGSACSASSISVLRAFDRSSAEAEFEPLYAEMNRRGAVLFYHPVQNGICSPIINDYQLHRSVGASLEDSAIVLHLIARRVPERYPNIKYVVPHLGGIISMLLPRLDNQGARTSARTSPKRPASPPAASTTTRSATAPRRRCSAPTWPSAPSTSSPAAITRCCIPFETYRRPSLHP